MFTEKAQAIIDLAKDCAFAHAKDKLDIESLLAAVNSSSEAMIRLAECLTDGDVANLRDRFPGAEHPAPCSVKFELTEPLRKLIMRAKELASGDGVPDRLHPGLIDISHLICAIAASREACRLLGGLTPTSRDDAIRILTAWSEDSKLKLSLPRLVSKLRRLRTELIAKVFGQDHAIHSFLEALYNAEITGSADKERKKPEAVFVFAGPPGVGKTYMAELCAAYLERPFKRFDMTGYSDHHAHNQLVGFAPSYKGASPGLLTGFVEKNPNAILLFDEIEKAHLTTVQLFYQILDAGRLEDKFTEQEISFRDTLIIFTTNAGCSLYENTNKVGINVANSSYHKRTILSALENEVNPSTGQPAFPKPICSRLAQGYPLLFNHLGINELERVCDAEMRNTEKLLEKQFFKNISHNSELPISLVFCEGGRVDARQIKSETEKFVKSELFKYCSLYTQDRLEDALEGIDSIRFEIEARDQNADPAVKALFKSPQKPKILLVANNQYQSICQDLVPEVNWLTAASATEVADLLSTEDIDMVLLDIWIRRKMTDSIDQRHQDGNLPESRKVATIDQDIDFIPFSARAFDEGREVLHQIHARFPLTPVYLLSFALSDVSRSDERIGSKTTTVCVDAYRDKREDSVIGGIGRRPIDDELFLACVRAGGARGILTTHFTGQTSPSWKANRDEFLQSLLEVNHRLYREKKARALARERKILTFSTVVDLNSIERQLTIRLRNFSVARTIEAIDAGELINEVERPSTRFSDVIGANSAKEALKFVIDWLKNPKRFIALGIRPPKGILLTGPPGTGKTMLARAVAGESNCAFIEKSASSFVTMWQGSGPQNVRNLFGRARRYAPAVIFVDELDSIGIKRSGGLGAARAQEETLNAMLTEMDGFNNQSQLAVIVLAATNLAERLDDALKRRFDRSIEVEKPDKAARLQYLEKAVIQRQNSTVTLKAVERLAGQTAGMTIADLERIIHQAAVMAAHHLASLSDQILEEAFEKFRLGEIKETPDSKTLERIARHEAGHALIAWLGGNPPVQVTIVGRGSAGGFMERDVDETKMIHTKSEIEQRICESMGGRAAEILYYGKEEGLSTGVAKDLQNATAYATQMVREYGMTEDFGQVAILDQRSLDGPLAVKVTQTAEKIVHQQLQEAIEILNNSREYLDKLSSELLEKNRLTKDELEKVLPPLKSQ